MPGETATVMYWPQRIFVTTNISLTGHVALAFPGGYASWAPASAKSAAGFGRVGPNPRPSLAADIELAGGSQPVATSIDGLDVGSIAGAWRSQAAALSNGPTTPEDQLVQGPPVPYQLTPDLGDPGVSCATLVVKLLRAGGAEQRARFTGGRIVTPRDVQLWAEKLARG